MLKDMSEVFLAPNEEMNIDRRDDTECDEQLPAHETIDLDDRRKPSICSNESVSSSSGEVSNGDPTGDTGKIGSLFLINKNCFLSNS
jgi:hypothetical protein